jgi:hypothetical protein
MRKKDEDKIIKIRSVRSECTRDIKGTQAIFFLFQMRVRPDLIALAMIKPLKRRWGC